MSRDRRAGPNATPLTVAQALRHLEKAHEYLRAAQWSLARGDLDAAGGSAVLAGINAADCVSGALQGTRWNGAHEQAATHVKKVGTDGKAVAAQLAKLVRRKNQAHYASRSRYVPQMQRILVVGGADRQDDRTCQQSAELTEVQLVPGVGKDLHPYGVEDGDFCDKETVRFVADLRSRVAQQRHAG